MPKFTCKENFGSCSEGQAPLYNKKGRCFMLNVDTIKNGLVIDHIRSGSGWRIFQWLGLDKAPFCAALIMNVPSKKKKKKDMIKIDNVMDIDYSVLGFIDPNICVNIIQNEKIIRKVKMELPSRVQNVFTCKNPRCITTVEQEIDQIFELVNTETRVYRCIYCETEVNG